MYNFHYQERGCVYDSELLYTFPYFHNKCRSLVALSLDRRYDVVTTLVSLVAESYAVGCHRGYNLMQ